MTNKPEVMNGESLNIAAQRRDELKQLFPGVFTETKDTDGNVVSSIDFERLKAELGTFSDIFEGRRERYGMEWPGKRDCMKVIQEPSRATLKPCPDESVDWDTTKNLIIEGDNLEVLKLLQKSYYGKVKMIYIDPPYNTGNEFIYPDNYQETLDTYLTYAGLLDDEGKKFTTNTASEGRYHTRWMNMMFPRLFLARNLLREDGVVFISIDDHEQENLKRICNEIFGEENFITSISRMMKSGGAKGKFFTPNIEYILIYAKNVNEAEHFRAGISEEQISTYYNKKQLEGERAGELYGEERLYKASLDARANQRYWIECPDGSFVIPPGETFPDILEDGKQITPNKDDGVWKWTYARYKDEFDKGNIVFKETTTSALVDQNGNNSKYNLYNKLWLKDQQEKGKVPGNFISKWENRQSAAELKELDIPFDFAKPSNLLAYLIEISRTKEDDIHLDFFAGSGSFAHAVMKRNALDQGKRRCISVQLPEPLDADTDAGKKGFKTIADICKARIKKVGEVIKKEKANFDLDLGFKVLKLYPSNFKIWHSVKSKDVDSLQTSLDLSIDNVVDGVDQLDLLFEILLKAGFEPTESINQIDLSGKRLYSIANGALLICLEDQLTAELIDEVIKLEPMQFICLDKGFQGNDQLKANTAQAFKARSQDSEAEMVFKVV